MQLPNIFISWFNDQYFFWSMVATLENEKMLFWPLLCTLFRLNWVKQTFRTINRWDCNLAIFVHNMKVTAYKILLSTQEVTKGLMHGKSLFGSIRACKWSTKKGSAENHVQQSIGCNMICCNNGLNEIWHGFAKNIVAYAYQSEMDSHWICTVLLGLLRF